MYFLDRYDAALKLIPLLAKYKNEQSVILAVPRGGVPIGYYLAKYFDFPLDLLMAKKIGHPANEEFAIGAVGMEGSIIDTAFNVPKSYIDKEISRIRKSLNDRYKKFMGNTPPVDLKGKIVIVVDDGVATGKTILVSLRLLRSRKAAKLVVAVPVASAEAARLISAEADEFICVNVPQPFYGVGRFYRDFSETTDDEVITMLAELNMRGKVA